MKKIVAMMVFVLVLGIFTQNVFAEDKEYLSESEKEKLIENFSELGIDKETQSKLIKKMENGEILDSMKQENLNLAKSINEFQSFSDLDNSHTITFEDGSKAVYGHELVDQGFQTMLSSGSYTVKSYRYTGGINYSFYSDFVIRSGSDNDYISRSYNPNVSIIGGSYSDVKVAIQRKYETSSNRAYSRMDFSYTVFTGQGSIDLFFNVGDNDYETTLSKDDYK